MAARANEPLKKLSANSAPVEILVNCLGSVTNKAPEELDASAWRDGMEAKYFPFRNSTTAVLQRFRRRFDEWSAVHGNDVVDVPEIGTIVNVLGKGGRSPVESHLHGGAANAAIMLTTMGLAQHYGHMGIRVNAINPSLVLTPRFEQRFEEEARQAKASKVKLVSDLSKNIPLRRYARASEIAHIALFLGSAMSSYISGAVMSADAAYRPSL